LVLEGYRLYLATAKPHDYALDITAHFGLSQRMAAEFGPELDGTRNWKGDLLRHALEVTGERPEASTMVGDRHHDIAGRTGRCAVCGHARQRSRRAERAEPFAHHGVTVGAVGGARSRRVISAERGDGQGEESPHQQEVANWTFVAHASWSVSRGLWWCFKSPQSGADGGTAIMYRSAVPSKCPRPHARLNVGIPSG